MQQCRELEEAFGVELRSPLYVLWPQGDSTALAARLRPVRQNMGGVRQWMQVSAHLAVFKRPAVKRLHPRHLRPGVCRDCSSVGCSWRRLSRRAR